MKPKSGSKLINPQDSINKLILHFNVDKTIIMRDSLTYDNSDVIVSLNNNTLNNLLKFRFVKYYLN